MMMSPQKRIKVLFLLRTLRIGGAERQVIETISRLNPSLFESKLYCFAGGGPLQNLVRQYDIDATVFPPPDGKMSFCRRSLIYLKRLLALCRYIGKERPDIVHCYSYSASIYGGIAAKLAGVSVLITTRRNLGHFKDGRPFYQIFENLVNLLTDAVFVNSEAVKRDVLQREKIDVNKLYVLYNGVDVSLYAPQNTNSRHSLNKRDLGIPENAPVIGIIANLHPHKGYKEFLLAARNVHQQYPEARFLCIGEDRGIQQELENLVYETGLEQFVLFLGLRTDIPELLSLFDIQVSTSYEEGFSNAILEGMASGKAIVATAVGGTPESIVHEQTGLLVPAHNSDILAHAICSLLERPAFALQLGLNARNRAKEHFSLEKMIDKLEKLYMLLFSHKTSSIIK